MNTISIDLGTTNTQMAYMNEQGEPCIIQVGGQDNIPSVLFYDEVQEQLLVGKQAWNAYTRLRLRDARVAEQRLLCGEQFKPMLCERAVTADSCCFSPVRGREISWLEIVRTVFSFCKREAERSAFRGEVVQGIRLTHPAEFPSLELYESAARAAGFNRVEFVPEPESAYLVCERVHKLDARVLVFDMGGGTLDIVCAEKQENGQVHLSGEKRLTLHNVNVGGEYIDQALCNELFPQLRELPGAENYLPDDDFRRWVQQSVKEYLGEGWYEDCEATYYIEQPGTLARFSTVYTYDKLEELVNREYRLVFRELEHYIELRHESERPSMVLMVGGSSRMKPIQEQLRKMFPGRDKVFVPHDGSSLVAKGALLKSFDVDEDEIEIPELLSNVELTDLTEVAFDAWPRSKERARHQLKERCIGESEYDDKMKVACYNPELLALLIDAGVDVNAAIPADGSTALMRAAAGGHAECVKMLLATPDIDVNKADDFGRTALYWAARYGSLDCVRLLASVLLIDIHKADKLGRTPIEVAIQNGHMECVSLIRRIRRMRAGL